MKIEERFPVKVGESLRLDGTCWTVYEGDEMDSNDDDRLEAFCVFEVEESSALRRGTHFYDHNYGRNLNDVKNLDEVVVAWFLKQLENRLNFSRFDMLKVNFK